MMSNRHAMPARSANAPAGSTGIEILVLLGMRQLAVFAIALEGAGVLVKPVKDNRPGLAPPYALTQCATPVVPDAADDIARSEERRVGKAGASRCKSRGSPN